jgi:hypothetical protein
MVSKETIRRVGIGRCQSRIEAEPRRPASPTVSALYQDYFHGAEYAAPSIIWMDFYEDHMETQAGRNVAQIVELAKTITLNR